MEINKRTIALLINSSIIILTLTFLFFILDMYKDFPKKIFEDFFFNMGLIICLILLPVMCFITFLISKIKSDPEKTFFFKDRFKKILRLNSFLLLANILGIFFLLSPFKFNSIANGKISYMAVSFIGFILGLLIFIFSNFYLKKGLEKDKQKQ